MLSENLIKLAASNRNRRLRQPPRQLGRAGYFLSGFIEEQPFVRPVPGSSTRERQGTTTRHRAQRAG